MTEIIGNMHARLQARFERRMRSTTEHSGKAHSIASLQVVVPLIIAPPTLALAESEIIVFAVMRIFFRVMGILCYTLIPIMAGAAIYEWLYFSYLRRNGFNTDRNLLLEETAGAFRKCFFAICLSLILAATVLDLFHIMPYFSREINTSILYMAIIGFFLEEFRLFLTWSNRKHLLYFVICTLPALVII